MAFIPVHSLNMIKSARFWTPSSAISSYQAANHRTASRHSLIRMMADIVKPSQGYQLHQKQGYKILDVRSEQEYSQGHAPGSINIPFMLLSFMGMSPNPAFATLVTQKLNPKDKYVVMCKSGGRSAKACSELEKMDFGSLADVDGGITSWVTEGLPVEK
mmetsp:Transcript_15694/g.27531  ORF Transcript_15694/g.27531 Transcript_15694/m.27531 type:complete len:159 (-) Transcript_15694:53-529(-)